MILTIMMVMVITMTMRVVMVMVMTMMMVAEMETKMMMGSMGRLALSGQRSIETDRSIQGCIALNWYLVHFTRGGC